jgi:N-acetylglucosamine-6-phosphate deacetylase
MSEIALPRKTEVNDISCLDSSAGGSSIKIDRSRISNAVFVFPDHICSDLVMEISGEKILKFTLRDHGETELPGTAPKCQDFLGDIVIPGLIDTHIHGAGGCDVMDGTGDSLSSICSFLLTRGTTGFLPTTMSASIGAIDRALEIAERHIKLQGATAGENPAAEILGVHLEGPFLSTDFKGAQDERYITAPDLGGDLDILRGIIGRHPGLIRILTLAIERPDATKLVSYCIEHKIIPSVGHSGASYEEMQRLMATGLKHVTHAFNAMPGIHHRRPGILTVALTDSQIWIELIADGIHIHPAVLALSFALKGSSRICLVSDGNRTVGLPDGEYDLGGKKTTLKGGVVTLPDGTLAGSSCSLLDGIRVLVRRADIPLFVAVRCATLNPATMLGVEDRLGSLEAGKEATFLRLSKDLLLKEVWFKGKTVFRKG